MNRTFSIFSLLFVMSGLIYGQNAKEENELDQIRDRYKHTNINIEKFKKVEFPDVEVFRGNDSVRYSIEGTTIYRLATASMTKYFDGDELVKIVMTFIGDREHLISEYFFHGDSLFFVDKLMTIYHKPKWHDDFDESAKSILKNRFYFKDGRLLKWVNTDVQSVGRMDPDFKKNESTILSDIDLYRDI